MEVRRGTSNPATDRLIQFQKRRHFKQKQVQGYDASLNHNESPMQSDTEQNNTNNNIFTLCIDRIMEETMKNKRAGISWTMLEMLEDLDFADDIYIQLFYHTNKKTPSKEKPTSF